MIGIWIEGHITDVPLKLLKNLWQRFVYNLLHHNNKCKSQWYDSRTHTAVILHIHEIDAENCKDFSIAWELNNLFVCNSNKFSIQLQYVGHFCYLSCNNQAYFKSSFDLTQDVIEIKHLYSLKYHLTQDVHDIHPIFLIEL